MATGSRPYPSYNKFQIVTAHMRGELPEIPSSLPEQLQSFLRECLQGDPKKRPSVAELMTHPFVVESWEDIDEVQDAADRATHLKRRPEPDVAEPAATSSATSSSSLTTGSASDAGDTVLRTEVRVQTSKELTQFMNRLRLEETQRRQEYEEAFRKLAAERREVELQQSRIAAQLEMVKRERELLEEERNKAREEHEQYMADTERARRDWNADEERRQRLIAFELWSKQNQAIRNAAPGQTIMFQGSNHFVPPKGPFNVPFPAKPQTRPTPR